jgi:hypothetical protein
MRRLPANYPSKEEVVPIVRIARNPRAIRTVEFTSLEPEVNLRRTTSLANFLFAQQASRISW